MPTSTSISDIRREYGGLELHDRAVLDCPIMQFEQWFQAELLIDKADPTSMVLSTVDEHGHPDSRVVLLKGLEEGRFVFYTNYHSAKGKQLHEHPYAALNFYWPIMARQVRIRGPVSKVSAAESDAYFSSRPPLSQLSAIASAQSQVIGSRAVLEAGVKALFDAHQHTPVVRPPHWGGYAVTPDELEFWQGRDNRLHDRIYYIKKNGVWSHRRLAP